MRVTGKVNANISPIIAKAAQILAIGIHFACTNNAFITPLLY